MPVSTPYNADEKELLLRLQAGDHEAFSLLYEQYATLVYRRIKRLVHIHEFAEELTQDVFLKIWEKHKKLDLEVSFEIIVRRNAKSIAINFYRKAMRDIELKRKLAQSGSELFNPVVNQINFNETQAVLNAAIAKLPPQRQKVFILCKLEGKSYEYAANFYGVSIGTIKDHMAKAMRTLKQELSLNNTVPPAYLLFISFLIM